MSIKLYQARDGGCGKLGKYAWSDDYTPFDEIHKFLDKNSSLAQGLYDYWKLDSVKSRPPGFCIYQGALKWPDILFSVFYVPGNIVSQKVIDTFDKVGCKYEILCKAPIGEILSKRLKKIPPPDYFIVKIFPGIHIAWDTLGYAVDNDGYLIVDPRPKPLPPSELPLYSDSWNSEPLFSYSNYRPNNKTMFCSEGLRMMAIADGWESVAFREVELF